VRSEHLGAQRSQDSGDGSRLPEEPSHRPITLCDSPVDTVESCHFLGSTTTHDHKGELNISTITKKAQQRMYFLRRLKRFNLPKTMMVHFYTAVIESILTSSITIWYAAVIGSTGKVIGCNLPLGGRP